ncbi:peptidase S8/S53 domain-containing protein [Fimicolochytrium jonesii]|uniref:peptidase S8/S53 domain-containing protein n=1 Tax=Fimicolochytrium jonesii TaxID=1396493 RepID=UPI0022FDC40E|nr:peptidase S8/S53 domain-containing protein [Fimicolochytrium jonesii]KAI8821066.1 peptidase S8/S53 domain-containing protein [Fimicolochytrium jonesii]
MPRKLHAILASTLASVLLLTPTTVISSFPRDFGPAIPPNDHVNFHYFAVKLDPPPPHVSSAAAALDDDYYQTLAKDIGTTLGVHTLGRVGQLQNYYLYAASKDQTLFGRSQEQVEAERTHHEKRFASKPNVAWVKTQIPQRRLFARAPTPAPQNERGRPFRLGEIMKELGIEDPGFQNQWHLVNTVTIGNDMNVTGVWRQGITGHNATVCFVDDGLDYENEDLTENFYAEGSYDYNTHVASPKPKEMEDHHGTRCAGEVAAVKNKVCGVGVAYNAKVSGVRILGGELTEADEAAAINFDFHNNHIYSCSWGPTDDGRAMEAPPQIVSDAVRNGIDKGRDGLGSIFVFASGNGAASGDHCNADGYTNSIYTVTVGALDRNNQHPIYSEACSAVMIVMYSSSGAHLDAIYTSDWSSQGSQCTNAHGGTSAAAPLASGVYALVLQIRPDLTWRDIQHLTVRTALPVNRQDPGWSPTAQGRPFNNKFGFGKLDAYTTIEAAKTFQKVNPQTHLTSPVIITNAAIPGDGSLVESAFEVTEAVVGGANMKRIEHVTVTVEIAHPRRGDVEVALVSPRGIVSELCAARPRDAKGLGFRNWTFMSVKHWDEDPRGTWKIQIKDAQQQGTRGTFHYWWMTIWGEQHSASASPTPPNPTSTIIASPTSTPFSPTPTHTTSLGASTLPASPTPTSPNLSTPPAVPATSSPGYALAFGFLILGAAGGGFYVIRRRRLGTMGLGTGARKSFGGGGGPSVDEYEFRMLSDHEVDAAFEDEDDAGVQVGLVAGRQGRGGDMGAGNGAGNGGSGRGGQQERFVLEHGEDEDAEAFERYHDDEEEEEGAGGTSFRA